MVEQSSDVGMMQRLGRRRVAVALGDLRIRHEQFDQSLEVRILKGCDKLAQRSPEFADILGCLGQVVSEIDFGLCHAAEFVDGQLKSILVFVDQTLDLEEVVLLEAEDKLIDVVPHFGFELAAAISQDQGQIRLAIFLSLYLLRGHYEAGGNDFILLITTFGDKKLFHEPPLNRAAPEGAFPYGNWRRA